MGAFPYANGRSSVLQGARRCQQVRLGQQMGHTEIYWYIYKAPVCILPISFGPHLTNASPNIKNMSGWGRLSGDDCGILHTA